MGGWLVPARGFRLVVVGCAVLMHILSDTCTETHTDACTNTCTDPCTDIHMYWHTCAHAHMHWHMLTQVKGKGEINMTYSPSIQHNCYAPDCTHHNTTWSQDLFFLKAISTPWEYTAWLPWQPSCIFPGNALYALYAYIYNAFLVHRTIQTYKPSLFYQVPTYCTVMRECTSAKSLAQEQLTTAQFSPSSKSNLQSLAGKFRTLPLSHDAHTDIYTDTHVLTNSMTHTLTHRLTSVLTNMLTCVLTYLYQHTYWKVY